MVKQKLIGNKFELFQHSLPKTKQLFSQNEQVDEWILG